MERFLKKILPKSLVSLAKNERVKYRNRQLRKLPLLDIAAIKDILTNQLNIVNGDTVFIHSSLGNLNLACSPFDILNLLIELVGEKGTILFPTYPKLTSYKFLKSGSVFNIKKTPSYMGILSEIARRHNNAIRSLHPTKSVVAIGQHAIALTKDHHKSVYPYSEESPYFKINHFNGKIIGLGVGTTNLSCVHCVDDFMKDKFPVMPYDEEIFNAKCLDNEGSSITVKTYAHLMKKMDFNIPKFIDKYVEDEICKNININGMSFFRADSNKLYEKLLSLAMKGRTIYNKKHYRGR